MNGAVKKYFFFYFKSFLIFWNFGLHSLEIDIFD